jgi:hypothetical protein
VLAALLQGPVRGFPDRLEDGVVVAGTDVADAAALALADDLLGRAGLLVGQRLARITRGDTEYVMVIGDQDLHVLGDVAVNVVAVAGDNGEVMSDRVDHPLSGIRRMDFDPESPLPMS